MNTVETQPGSRAVLRVIEAGNRPICALCGAAVKFNAKTPSKERKQIIANVYVDGKWDRIETFHPGCYDECGEPYGKPVEK